MNKAENTAKLLQSLGLCMKAGAVICGVPAVCEAMRKSGAGKPLLVLEGADTSDNTHKKIVDKCSFYGVRHVRLSCDTQMLAEALGRSAALGAAAVTDAGLCRLVEKYI